MCGQNALGLDTEGILQLMFLSRCAQTCHATSSTAAVQHGVARAATDILPGAHACSSFGWWTSLGCMRATTKFEGLAEASMA